MHGYCPDCNEPLTITAILGGMSKRVEFCPECRWSEDEERLPMKPYYENHILIHDNPDELRRACPQAGRYTGYHRSHLGTNFCTQGDDKAKIISTIREQAESKGLETIKVLDETADGE